MGRLIDEAELMRDVRNSITEKSGTIDWMNLINRQPAACDPEKVVAELEEHFNATNDKGARLAYHHAIQIVKGGGVDGN